MPAWAIARLFVTRPILPGSRKKTGRWSRTSTPGAQARESRGVLRRWPRRCGGMRRARLAARGVSAARRQHDAPCHEHCPRRALARCARRRPCAQQNPLDRPHAAPPAGRYLMRQVLTRHWPSTTCACTKPTDVTWNAPDRLSNSHRRPGQRCIGRRDGPAGQRREVVGPRLHERAQPRPRFAGAYTEPLSASPRPSPAHSHRIRTATERDLRRKYPRAPCPP